MEKKYPVLKCDEQLWKEIKPVLESFGISFANVSFDSDNTNYIVTNWGCEGLDQISIGITYYPKNTCIEGLRYLVNNKEEFLSIVAKLLGKEYPIKSDFKNFKYSKESDEKENISQEVIISKNGNNFDKDKNNMDKINIANKLKYCKKGTKLYSPIFGEVEFENVDDKIEVIVHTDKEDICKAFFEKDGKYYMSYKNAECLLFPSKDNRDWNTFQVLEKGHRVMCSDDDVEWKLREYVKDCYTKTIGADTGVCEWEHIVPVEDFDFTAEDITINKERSII